MTADKPFSSWTDALLPFVVSLILYECARKPIPPDDHAAAVSLIESSVYKAIGLIENADSVPIVGRGPSEDEKRGMTSFLMQVLKELQEKQTR